MAGYMAYIAGYIAYIAGYMAYKAAISPPYFAHYPAISRYIGYIAGHCPKPLMETAIFIS